MQESLRQVAIKRVVGPTPNGAAVFLGGDDKVFVVFVGYYEAMAILRELKHEETPRPLTHDLMHSVCLGFDLTVKQIIVSDIIEDAFCATLILEQRVSESNGNWAGKRNEVRIDARPSDCFVLALKTQADIYVTEKVYESVQDVSHLGDDEGELADWMSGGFSASAIPPSSPDSLSPESPTSENIAEQKIDLGDVLPPELFKTDTQGLTSAGDADSPERDRSEADGSDRDDTTDSNPQAGNPQDEK